MTLPGTTQKVETDLFIVGAGMAGMSAAAYAANRNIKTVVAGAAGGFEYASGLLDLWGLSLTQKRKITKKPWDMHAMLGDCRPDHPLAKLDKKQISKGFSELLSTLEKHGLAHTGYTALNHTVLTPFGTLHPTFRLPMGLKANAETFKRKPRCLVLDFKGLREFSARFFCEMLKHKWTGLEPACIRFPGTRLRSEVFTPFLARSMETPGTQKYFIQKVKPLLKGKQGLGVPAMLGVQSSETIRQHLEDKLGVPVFEIPTSPVSVPGSRLKEALTRALEDTSVIRLFNQRVTRVLKASDNGFECLLGTGQIQTRVRSKAVILATGRFLSRGLITAQDRIKEPLFDLDVFQPGHRRDWHDKEYFSPDGHRINQAGLETDLLFRPINPDRGVVYKNMFAAGSILAHQDWVRTKSGSGLAIGTAFRAIKSYLQIVRGTC